MRKYEDGKVCNKCGEWYPLSRYTTNGKTGKHYSICKDCCKRRKVDPKHKSNQKLRKYGLTISDFERMILEQDSKCGICGEPQTSFHIDHCHETGALGKLLCQRCNMGLGLFRDSTIILEAAIRYIKEVRPNA